MWKLINNQQFFSDQEKIIYNELQKYLFLMSSRTSIDYDLNLLIPQLSIIKKSDGWTTVFPFHGRVKLNFRRSVIDFTEKHVTREETLHIFKRKIPTPIATIILSICRYLAEPVI